MPSWYTIYDHTIYARWGLVHLADTKLLEKTATEVHAAFIDGNFVVKRTKRCFSHVAADQATEWMDRTYKMQNGAIGISHPSTMPGSNSLVRPTWVWRCYPQLEMPWNFTLHAPTTRQISGAGRPGTYRCLIVYQHIDLDEGVRLPESFLHMAALFSKCLSGTCDLWMLINIYVATQLANILLCGCMKQYPVG